MQRVTLFLALLTIALIAPAQAQGAPRMVSGRVYDDSSGCPLKGAQVSVGPEQAHASTDIHGRYRIANPPTASFSLRVTLAGYEPQQVDNIAVSDSAARVDFSLFRAFRDGSTQASYPKTACHLEPRDSM